MISRSRAMQGLRRARMGRLGEADTMVIPHGAPLPPPPPPSPPLTLASGAPGGGQDLYVAPQPPAPVPVVQATTITGDVISLPAPSGFGTPGGGQDAINPQSMGQQVTATMIQSVQDIPPNAVNDRIMAISGGSFLGLAALPTAVEMGLIPASSIANLGPQIAAAQAAQDRAQDLATVQGLLIVGSIVTGGLLAPAAATAGAGATAAAEGAAVASGELTASEIAALSDIGAGYEGAAATSSLQNVALAESTGSLPAGTLAAQIGSESAALMLADADVTAAAATGSAPLVGIGSDFDAAAMGTEGGAGPDFTGFGSDFDAAAMGTEGGAGPDMTGFASDFDAGAMGVEGGAAPGPAAASALSAPPFFSGAGGDAAAAMGGEGTAAGSGTGSGGIFSEGAIPGMDQIQKLLQKLPAYLLKKKPAQQKAVNLQPATQPTFFEENATPILGVSLAIGLGLLLARKRNRS